MNTVFDITPETAFKPENRRLYIGGTDIAAICGLSNYKTAYEVWLEKTGQVVPEDQSDNDLLYWGHVLEPHIADKWLKDNPDWEVITANEFTPDPEEPYMCSNTDRRIRNKITGEIAIMECKTVASSAFKHWKLGIPLNYYAQGQWYLGVGGYDRVIFVLFIMDSREMKTLEIVRDEDFILELRDEASNFWNNNVLKMVSPEKTVVDWTKLRATDEACIATPEILVTLEELKVAKEDEKLAAARVKELEEPLKLYIKDNKTLLHPETEKILISWNGSDVTRAVGTKVIQEVVPEYFSKLTKTNYERKFLIK